MFVGRWIVIGEDGIWFSPFADTYTFKTKTEAIEDVRSALLDERRIPKVKRCDSGEYIYTPKDVDSGRDGNTYYVVRITKNKAEHYRKMIQEQESREDNICLW